MKILLFHVGMANVLNIVLMIKLFALLAYPKPNLASLLRLFNIS